MKDILIVVSPSSSKQQDFCKEMKQVAKDNDTEAKVFLESAILLTGHRSLETAILLYNNAEKIGLPISLFEIESVLTPSKEQVAEV